MARRVGCPRLQSTAMAVAVVVLMAGCASASPTGSPSDPVASPSADPTGDNHEPTASASPTTVQPVTTTIPTCEEVPRIAAPADVYRDEPIYVANEMPDQQVREWASTQDGFEQVWIDRDHHGWVTVGFGPGATRDRADLQAEVASRFPDDGVAVVEVPHDRAELEALQEQVRGALGDQILGSGTAVHRGVVELFAAARTPGLLERLATDWPGQPLCLDGGDPADLPEPGPQRVGGDGWRLLAHEQGAGEPYRTEIAGDAGAYERLWTSAGVDGPRPEVDFAAEVVIWFGDVYGSSCPDLRLDDVIVADDMVFMDRVILPDGGVACTDDANPWAWVVAVDRSHLPRGGFAIQLDADDPPAGAPLERTVVTTDLTVPGSVPDPAADPHPAPSPTSPGTPTYFEAGFPQAAGLAAACIDLLGPINDVVWTPLGDIPTAWRDDLDDGRIEVELELTVEPPLLTARAHDSTLTWEPAANAPTDDACR